MQGTNQETISLAKDLRQLKLISTTALVLAVATLLTLIFFSNQASASDRYTRVSSQLAKQHELKTDALETYRGQLIRTQELLRQGNSREILNDYQIETTSGEIIYPEEVEYILIQEQDALGLEEVGRFPFNNDGGPR